MPSGKRREIDRRLDCRDWADDVPGATRQNGTGTGMPFGPMARQTGNPIGSKIRKINIVLHHQTTLANGYVALGPFRSEYYLVPGSNLFEFGNLPWYEQLAVHE